MQVTEIVVLSGKGGTGKTSLSAAFAQLMSNPVLVDCDVDAANLHLLLAPAIEQSHDFVGAAKAHIDGTLCDGCGLCAETCRFDAIRLNGQASIDNLHCEGCGVCARRCPAGAISLVPQLCGQWFPSRTRCGPLVHARLAPGQENSGKLVATLRRAAKAIAAGNGARWILVDGPPGTGCPVISSLTGAAYAVFVTEPTVSGFADLRRAAAVADHFQLPTGVVINKADINAAVADRVAEYAAATGRDLLGRIPYDPLFTRAQMAGTSVLDVAPAGLRKQLEDVWRAVECALATGRRSLAAMQ